MLDREQMVTEIAQEVIARLSQQPATPVRATPRPAPRPVAPRPPGIALGDGVFRTVDDAVQAAATAQERVAAMTLGERGRIVETIKRLCEDHKQELGRAELEETKIGRLEDKIAKLEAIKDVLGVEAMRTEARSDASGLCLVEHAPWGVVGMVLPATHSAPTLASNAINVIAAGNTAVFSPHPAGARVAARALQMFNREIQRATGVANVLTTMAEPSIEAAGQIFHHPDVALLTVTGGPVVVREAMKAGKRVIAAGPGNPPVVVDETACLDRAAESIIEGGGFDNNLLCIAEKEVFVVESVFADFMAAMRRAGARELDGPAIERLSEAAFEIEAGKGVGCGQAHLKRDLVGKDASVLAEAAGVHVPGNTVMLFGETAEDHPFVQVEQMMPFMPIVRVRDVDAGIAAAVRAEHGYRHTAIIHSRNVENVTKMAKALNTTLVVQNAPCTAALGTGAPSYLSFSIATPTGEGVTTPMTFTRERQLTVTGALRIH
ncbi:MAG: aldehyde dehydrogenase EutE [Acidobacteria bacterium]|jgi:aldehyde dehydrogenase|nr:aldehyde dehydrogenase EutE [Acidobacteriota bacterium]